MLAEAKVFCDPSAQAGFYAEKVEEKDDGTRLSPIGGQTRTRSIHTNGQKGYKSVTFRAPGNPRLGVSCPAGGQSVRFGSPGEQVRGIG